MNAHIEAWNHVKEHLYGRVCEVSRKSPWGFKEDKEDIIRFNKLWYILINQLSRRDQITYNYCLWKLGVKQSFIPGSIFDNKFLKWK